MQKLTARQAQILDLIRSSLEHDGLPPTRAEIARQLGFRSPNAAEAHLQALARKGAIELIPGTSRGIRLCEESTEAETGLPVVGRVAAGQPILASEHVEDHYGIDPGVFHPTADYLLRVRGDSMREAGILDGDLLAVHATPEALNGQIVVARLGEEVTVKRFQRQGRKVRLLAENPEYRPIEIDLGKQELTIEGLAVGLIRN